MPLELVVGTSGGGDQRHLRLEFLEKAALSGLGALEAPLLGGHPREQVRASGRSGLQVLGLARKRGLQVRQGLGILLGALFQLRDPPP